MPRKLRGLTYPVPLPGRVDTDNPFTGPVYFHPLVPAELAVKAEELELLFQALPGKLVVLLLDDRFAFWGHLLSITPVNENGICTLIAQCTSQRNLFLSVSRLTRSTGLPSYSGTLLNTATQEHSILCRRDALYLFIRQTIVVQPR